MAIKTLSAFALCSLLSATNVQAQSVDAGGELVNGLKADYYNNMQLSGQPTITRIDPEVKFNWGYGAPGKAIGVDKFSVRWQGLVEAPVTGKVVFTTLSDDGIRVWINNRLVIDDWRSHSVTQTTSAPLSLKAGKRYAIRVEYYESGTSAMTQLQWSYAKQATPQVVPTKYLYATPPTAPPSDLTAAGYLGNSDSNNAALPYIELNWKPVLRAKSYNVYRNGSLYKPGLTGTTFKDTGVESGRIYGYSITAVSANDESDRSNPAVADAPFAPNSTGSKVPVNLRVLGTRTDDTNKATDLIFWDPVAEATSYNLYLYDVLIASELKDTQYALPAKLFKRGLTYTVTAVGGPGNQESIPSNIATAQGILPFDSIAAAPPLFTPTRLTATPEWNAGAPRIVLAWRSNSLNATFNVYRDGELIASGVWGLTYQDQDVSPGESHVYTVSGIPWGKRIETAQTAPAEATAPANSPVSQTTLFEATRVVANDDSVVVFFPSVPGAKDYRVYSAHNPNVQKYSGGGLSIEMNGIDPDEGADLVIEAVDKLGPYQKMDGEPGPGAIHAHTGELGMIINGMGDPSNVPNVLAQSRVFHVDCKRRTLTGEQTFFDTFRDGQPFVPAVIPAKIAANIAGVRGVENDKWLVYNYAGDFANSRVFMMGSHFMDTLYDGGTPGGPLPLHNNNASLVMTPKKIADVSGGKVLHVTFEVDGHFNPRRWCDLVVAPASDDLLQPAKIGRIELPTTSGNMFRWEIQPQRHIPMVFTAPGGVLNNVVLDAPVADKRQVRRVSNGTKFDLDKRHRFDLYLSQKRFVLMEDGVIVRETDFPLGSELTFSRMKVHFVHQLYHTGNDRPENMNFDPDETYWINHRPWADERHWDNMGFEVLKNFP